MSVGGVRLLLEEFFQFWILCSDFYKFFFFNFFLLVFVWKGDVMFLVGFLSLSGGEGK